MRKCTPQKYNYNFQTFYKEDFLSYYLLGAFITDGCIYISKDRPNKKCIDLTSKDKDWLEIINKYICPDKPILKHGKNCYKLTCYSTELANWFISKGCGPRKSLIVNFPNIPIQFLSDFIRGCWDGDGSLSFTKSGNGGKNYQRQANLTSGSLSFCNSLCEELNKLNIKCKVKNHGRSFREIEGRILKPSNCFRVVISGGESTYNLCKLLYSENKISMPRKQKIAQDIIDDWEKKIQCINCHCIIDTIERQQKRCAECQRLHMNEIHRKRYHLKKINSPSVCLLPLSNEINRI